MSQTNTRVMVYSSNVSEKQGVWHTPRCSNKNRWVMVYY
jgi:hypothetical protein